MNQEEHDKLIALEAETKVRWENHAKRSEDIWGQIQGQIKAIFTKIDNLQCQTHAEKHRGINKQIAWLWSLIVLILSSCLGGFVYLMRNM